MLRASVVCVLLAIVPPAVAEEQPLMCFGNEPSGGVALDTPGTAPPGSGAAPPAASASIEGPVWQLASLGGLDPKALEAVPGGVTVRFEAGQLQSFAGCNRFRGTYSIDADRVTIGHLAGTLMACPEPHMAVETAVKKALAGTLRFAVADDRLTLTSEADPHVPLVFRAAPPPSLEGVTWEVTGFNNGRDAVVSPVLGTTLTLSFQDGVVSGHAGCNTYRAPYTREGDRLTVGPAATTRKMCAGKGVMDQEREFLAAIGSATTWSVERDVLDVHRADGQRALMAKRTE